MNPKFLPVFFAFVFACSQPYVKKGNSLVRLNNDTSITSQISEMTTPHEDNLDGFTFKYGYLKYDEEKYGFSNPGFIEIYKDSKLVFSDSFKGEGPVSIESLGHHNLQGEKLVFRLNYGTEACDYTYTSKYYVIDNGQIRFLKECYSFTGGDNYSSRFYEHIFPTDSAGQPNSILIVEGQLFHDRDQPDRIDTTYIKFRGDKLIITCPTSNLSKVK